MATEITLKPSQPEDLYDFLTERMRPLLLKALEMAGPGQRLRVTTLPVRVMERVCESLQGDARWVVRLLSGAPSSTPWKATATKIIELRNLLEKPLLVFIPPDLRTAAEDSLDIATFTELSLAMLADDLAKALLLKLPEPLQTAVREELEFLRIEGDVRNADQEVEYFLTVLKNGSTKAAAGGAIWLFGLIPDFELFERVNTRFWLTRNQRARDRLSDVTQPLQTRIRRIAIKPGTVQGPLFAFLRDRHADDVRAWAREVACDPKHRHLALEHWEFADGENLEELRLILEPLTLPETSKDDVTGTVQLPVLNLEGKDPLKVAFRSLPKPGQYPSWKTYRIQILSVAAAEGGASVVWESNGLAKPQQGKHALIRRSIKVQDLQAIEEGTYYLKVDAYDADGALLTKPRRIDPENDGSRAENESDRFLIIRGNVVVDTPDVRSVFVSSLLDAWMQASAKALGGKGREREALTERATVRGEWDEAIGTPPKGDVHFELSTGGFAGYSIVVPSMLRKAELSLLQNPDEIGLYLMSFREARTPADVEMKLRERAELGEGPEVIEFMAARREVFRRILDHHVADVSPTNEQRSKHSGIVETVDVAYYAAAIERYAQAYVHLARAATTSGTLALRVKALAHLDVIELRWHQTPNDPGRALLVAPTHPLRLLWHLRHTAICQDAAKAWEDGSKRVPAWRKFFDQLRLGLLPMSLPMVLYDRRRRGYVEHTPLTAFWPLYLPDRTDGDTPIDGVAARDRVLHAMGVRDRTVAVTTVDCGDVAYRLFDYLAQHPYVDQLRLNVFNPGDGRLVADILRNLERLRLSEIGASAPPIRYAVHLFAAADHLDATGEGLESLLDPERQVGEDDEFTLASSNHLLPKLVFARNATTEFLHNPERFPAHVSLLLETFVVQSRVVPVEGLRRGSYVGGLVQEPETQVQFTGKHFGWIKGLRPETRRDASAEEQLVRDAVSAAQLVQASYTLGQPVTAEVAPVVSLQLDPAGQALLRQVHEVSDWVLTIDRNLGLDYFDSPSSAREAGYLLDFAPEYLQEDRQRILLTTQSTLELESLVRPVFEKYGFDVRSGDEVVILETLRSLSGRLALRMQSGPNQAAEVVGLSLARWLLERSRVLEHRIVIPLDAHRSWFAQDENATSMRRADLLLVGFAAPNTIRMDVVEVKLRDELSATGRSELYAQMRKQTEDTEERLRNLFAPDLDGQSRADALLRFKELTSALGFYIRRGQRYGLLEDEEAAAFIELADHLDSGFNLEMRSIGVLFECKGSGSHIDEEEPGFVVHRFGGDKARQLLADAVGRFSERMTRISERGDTRPSSRPPPMPSPEQVSTAAALRDEDVDSFRLAVSVRAPKPRPAPPPTRLGPEEPMPVAPPIAEPAKAPTPAKEPTLPSAVTAPVTSPAPAPPPVPSVPPPPTTAPVEVPPAAPVAPPASIADIFIGSTEATPQHGILGKSGSHKVALDLNGCNTISIFGVQGFGKSYTLGVIAEMAAVSVPGINILPSPLATVIFHYHKSDAYEPEFASAAAPNQKQSELERLQREYGASPRGLDDVVLLSPEAKVEQRRREYPSLTVEPIKFSSSELGAESWKFLLGAYGNDSLYIRQLVAIMRRHRTGLTLDKFRQEIQSAGLPPAAQRLADDRLNLAEPYIDDKRKLGELLRPGRTVIVDLRDEWIEKDEALGLFVVMMRIFAATKHQGRDFNKLVVFDEAHKYITESELISQVVETIREMRHQATSVVIASQDPLSVPRAVIELTSVLMLHRMTSPQWLKHLKTAIVALEDLADAQVTSLVPGEALIWAQRSSDKRFTQKPQKVHIRPRFTQHGGGTKTAVSGATVR